MTSDVYLDREGRQFGLETRVRVLRRVSLGNEVLYRLDGSIFTFPVLRARLWALKHGYGWL